MAETQDSPGAVGRIPSGLFIVTAVLEGRKEGYLASWVQQVSFQPLLVGVAIRPGRPCHAIIKAHGRFCINVVGHKNGGLMKPFWNTETPGDPFAELEHHITPKGNLIFANALAAIECEVRSSVMPGDHEILIAQAVDGVLLHPEDKPLTHVRKSGLVY